LLLVTIGCAAPPPTSGPNAEIEAHTATWIEALNAGDIETLVAIYADDALIMAPNKPLGRGADAVRAEFGAMIEAGLGGTMSTLEIVSAGDIGYHIGTYEITAEGEVLDAGKFIELWRLIDGEWKMTADMYSSDLPIPGAEEPAEDEMTEGGDD
jgi:ketosteroid isomerase-like protein